MADYWEDAEGYAPAYYVSCKHCGVDLWGRSGPHVAPCSRASVVNAEGFHDEAEALEERLKNG